MEPGALVLIAVAIALGGFLLARVRRLSAPPPVAGVAAVGYSESIKQVSALVGARSRDRVAEELLELMHRVLGLRRLVFFVPETQRSTNRKMRVLTRPDGSHASPEASIPRRSKLIVLTHRGIPPQEAENLSIDLLSESAPGTAARERKPVSRETTMAGAFAFGMATPIFSGEELHGVVASSDADAALVQIHHGDVVLQLCQLAAVALHKITTLERTTEHAEEEQRNAKRTYDMLASYVSPAVAEVLVAQPELLNREAEPAEVTVLFADIQDFTSLCEISDPAEVVRKLNAYLTVMSDIIMKFNGTVDKFVGDQIVAYWNRPVEQPDHAYLAAQAALAMREAQRRLRREWVAAGSAPLKMGIALNSGPVVFGHVGSARKKDLTVIGDTVNTCARLEKQTRVYGVDVVLGELTHQLIGARAVMRLLGEHSVKGKETPVKVFGLESLHAIAGAPTPSPV